MLLRGVFRFLVFEADEETFLSGCQDQGQCVLEAVFFVERGWRFGQIGGAEVSIFFPGVEGFLPFRIFLAE